MTHPSISDQTLCDDSPDMLRARIAELEQRLAELEGEIAQNLAPQLRYAEALADCSRILLTPVQTEVDFRQTLAQALHVVRLAAGADRITLTRYMPRAQSVAQAMQSYEVLAAATEPDLPPLPLFTPEELADIPPELIIWQQKRKLYNGPVAGQFPGHPYYGRYSAANLIRSMYIQPLTIGEHWWGHIGAIDHQQARTWSPGAVQLIQTAAEIMATFTESWEAAKALQEREALLRSITDALPDGYLYQVIQRPDGSYIGHTYLSGGVESLFGLTPVQIRANTAEFHALFCLEDRGLLDAADREALANLSQFDVETRARKADGSLGWFQIRAMPQLRPDGMICWNGLCLEVTARKQIELALADSEMKYRTLFALLPTGVMLTDPQGQIIEVNAAAERMLGLRADEQTARHLQDARWDVIRLDGSLFPSDEFPGVRALREARMIGEVEVGVARPDGRRTWLSVSAAPLEQAVGAVITFSDITARIEAEQALATQLRYAEALARCSQILLVEGLAAPAWEPVIQEAMTTLRTAIGCTRLALWLCPMEDVPVRHTSRMVADHDPIAPPFQLFSVDESELPAWIGQALLRDELIVGTLADLFPEPSTIRTALIANDMCSLLVASARVGTTWRARLIAADAAASRDWIEPAVRLLRTGLEMITAFIYQAEISQSLRAREALLRAVGDNLPRGFIYQIHRDSEWHPCFTYLSSGVAQTLGVAVEDGLRDANLIYAAICAEDQERVAAQERASALTLLDSEAIVRHACSGGEQRWIYLRSRPRHADDGSVIWDGLALDITERQRVNMELEQARDAAEAATRAKSAFLAAMSHEIRTPLNAVIGMAALLQDSALTADQRTCVDTIRAGGQALLGVISDILDFSRIESGYVALQSVPFDLPACLAAAFDLMVPGARQKGLHMGWACDPGVPQEVVGDEVRLRQVLLNLLSNAVKFTSQGEVMLHATATPQGEQRVLVTIIVRDTGIGIGPSRLEQIFSPFVQGDRATAQRYGGTGLGLAISRHLATLMGGEITVTSSVGAGSTFSVHIPFRLAAKAALPRPAASAAARATQPLRVLVAEDNEINQEVIRRMLVVLGHIVTVVADGQAALDALQQVAYDVVLMDVQMPILDGEAATRQIRQLGATISQPQIIALTANALVGDRERFLAAGMDDYLSKPVQPADLQAVLGAVPLK